MEKVNGVIAPIQQVQSICPICRKVVTAQYVEETGAIYLQKRCSEHGVFKVRVGNSRTKWEEWMKSPVINIAPKKAVTCGASEGESRCPLHCGPCKNHLQTACCVLIDITERCNQQCPYCFASAKKNENMTMSDGRLEPTLKELSVMYDQLLELGEQREFNIQISGGEPTVREDLTQIVAMGKDKGFRYIQLNTNGRRIDEEEGYAKLLKDAGVSVIFLQFDGTKNEIYRKMRGENLMALKEKAVDSCRKAGLPVTLVPTLVRGVNLDNVGAMMEYLLDNVDVVKGIHFQPVSFFGRVPNGSRDSSGRITMFDTLEALEEQTEFFRYRDFCPISTGHPLCCFYSTYIKEGSKVRCTLSATEANAGVSCCREHEVLEQPCCGESSLDIICKDRDYVLEKWDLPTQKAGKEMKTEGCGRVELGRNETLDFDSFLAYYKGNSFTVTGMAFMDGSNLDAERLKRCRVVQMTRDGKLIPFCAYNSIYRDEAPET